MGFTTMARELAEDMLNEIANSGMISDCKDILTGDIIGQSTIESGINNIFTATQSIGLALLVMYFVMEMMDKMTKEQWNAEIAIKMFIRYILAKTLIIDNGKTFLIGLFGVGKAMIGNVADVSAPTVTLDDQGFMMCLFMIIMSLFPWVLFQLVKIVLFAVAYERLIEIILRGGFAPIGMASMVQEGFSGHGLRYLKKYMGSCFQGAIMAGGLAAAGVVQEGNLFSSVTGSNSTFLNILTSSFGLLLVPIVVIGVCLKAGQIAQDVAGL